MVEINATYEGGLRCEATHGPSGNKLITDAPVDNHGKGEAFSPTDLVATALGTCMTTIMGIVAEKDGINLEDVSVHLVKEMVNKPVRRIAKVTLEFQMPAGLSEPERKRLENAALHCPVHNCLHPDIETPVEFHYPD